MSEAQPWTLDLDVREDAPSVFVPVGLLPDAAVGDAVTVASPAPATSRGGRIVERLEDHERGQFFVVSLE